MLHVTKVRVFVASPGDVQSERAQLSKVIDELNLTITAIAPEKQLTLELVKWETHVHPDMGRDAQGVVNQQIGDYDIFVGILWKRMGTPTAVAKSGTQEEFKRAYSLWRKNKKLHILFYFCQELFNRRGQKRRSPNSLKWLSSEMSFQRKVWWLITQNIRALPM